MFICIWFLIAVFSWILIMQPQEQEGFKIKKLGKSIAKTTTSATKTVAKTATSTTKTVAKASNQVGGAIAKVATAGMNKNTKMVLKNMKKIKQAIGSFIKKSAPYSPIPPSALIPLVGTKCGLV